MSQLWICLRYKREVSGGVLLLHMVWTKLGVWVYG